MQLPRQKLFKSATGISNVYLFLLFVAAGIDLVFEWHFVMHPLAEVVVEVVVLTFYLGVVV